MTEPGFPSGARWNPWPVSILAFFAVAILGCGIFVAFCARHPVDLVAADYYEQELRYQREIDRRHNAQRDAASASVGYVPASRRLTIALPADHVRSGLTGTIHLYRPSALDLDREIKLAPEPNGLQALDVADLRPGLWKVRVAWTAQNRDYLLERQVVIEPANQATARQTGD